jgi:hypothetical protein
VQVDNRRSRCEIVMELLRLDCASWTVWTAGGLCRLDNEQHDRLLAQLSSVQSILNGLPSHCGPIFAWNALTAGTNCVCPGNTSSRAA